MNYNHMTEKEAAAFRALGYEVKAHYTAIQSKKPGKWKLVYKAGESVQELISGAYALCQHKKNQCEKSQNFTLGKLKIIPK